MRSPLRGTLVRALLLAGATCVAAAPLARAQGAAPSGPIVSLKLADGSVVVGRVVKQDDTEVTLDTETFGVVEIPRAKITALLSGGAAAESKSAPAVHWTRTAQLRGMYSSAVVPGYIGATKGLDFTAKIVRRSAISSESFKLTSGFQKTDPNPASDDESSAQLLVTRVIRAPFHLLSETMLDRDRPQEINWRFTDHLGIGWNPIATKRAWFLIAPGLAYTDEQAPDSARIRNVAGGAFEDANGFGFGTYEAVSLTVIDGLSLDQDILMIHGFNGSPKLQYTGTANVIGMVTKTFGLSIGYSRRYDSTLPHPILRTLDQVLSGFQISF